MMDFPAPVSPESTFSPRERGRVSDSMMAKFLMRSSVSMRSARRALAVLPSQAFDGASRKSSTRGSE